MCKNFLRAQTLRDGISDICYYMKKHWYQGQTISSEKHMAMSATLDSIETFCFCCIPSGVVSSPFLLFSTISHHLQQRGCKLGEEIGHNTYVDNVLMGRSTPEGAKLLHEEAKTLFYDASMNLREWVSNDEEFCKFLPEKDQVEAKEVKCLGLNWNVIDDTLNLIAPNESMMNATPERGVLQAVAGLYDPVGLMSPLLIHGKVLIQDLWKQNVDWDEQIPVEAIRKWTEIAADLCKVGEATIKCFQGLPDSVHKQELHVFCDASEKAYGNVAYLREETSTDVNIPPIQEVVGSTCQSHHNPTP